jgi:hypothetical protein
MDGRNPEKKNQEDALACARRVTLLCRVQKKTRRERPLFLVRRSRSLDANRFFFLAKSGALN